MGFGFFVLLFLYIVNVQAESGLSSLPLLPILCRITLSTCLTHFQCILNGAYCYVGRDSAIFVPIVKLRVWASNWKPIALRALTPPGWSRRRCPWVAFDLLSRYASGCLISTNFQPVSREFAVPPHTLEATYLCASEQPKGGLYIAESAFTKFLSSGWDIALFCIL